MFSWHATGGWIGLILLGAAVGLIARRRHLRNRRRRSLRQEGDGTFVWTEIDGSTARSREDPRPWWDREDAADSHGGDGGDGDDGNV